MNVMDCIKKGFSVARSSTNLVMVLFGFSFLWTLINIPFQGATETDVPSIAVMVLGVAFIFISIYMQAGSLGYVKESIKSGSTDLANFTTSGKKYYLRVLGVGVVVALYITMVSIVALLIVLVGGGVGNALVGLVSLVLGIIGIIGVFLLFLAPYIVIVNDAKVLDAVKLSIDTVKTNVLKILGIGVLLVLVGFIVGLVIGAIIGLLGAIMQGTASLIISGFLSSIVNAYLGVVTSAAFMAFYLSLGSGGSSEA